MTTLRQLQTWVRAGEGETLEFKRTTGERREAARAICARRVMEASEDGVRLTMHRPISIREP
jgi:hypothetical protein